MKIVLANPSFKTEINRYYEKYFIRAGSRWPHSGIKRKTQLPHYLPFPFFLAYAAALLLKEGFDVEVIDAVTLDISTQRFKDMIEASKPDILLLETTTPTIEQDLILVREIKNKINTNIILTGTHVTTFALDLMQKTEEIDYILLGEYELTLLELAKRVREDKAIEGLRGLVYRKNGNIISTGRASLIEPLDVLPFPARDIFPTNSAPDIRTYWDGFCQNWPAIQMQASRGCPYNCSFCVWNQVIYANGKYRTFSPSRVVDEMEHIVNKYGAKEIYFDDDDFTINRQFVLSICQQIKQRNLNIKWSCMGDIINLDREVIRVMASAGCIGIKFGVESASKRILNKIGKPVDLDRVRQVAKYCNHYGIKTHATFTIGILDETPDTLRETFIFARGLNVSSIQVSICTPFPGTRLFQEAKEKGFLKNSEWSNFDGKAKGMIGSPYLDNNELEKFHIFFLRWWFISKLFNPSWLFSQFRNLSRTIKGLGLRFFIRQMVTVFEDELR